MWYAVVETKTGRLHSTGTILADPMPKQYEVIELGEDWQDTIDKEWDPKTKTFIPSQFLTRLSNYALAYKPWIAALTAAQKQDLVSLVRDLLTKPIG